MLRADRLRKWATAGAVLWMLVIFRMSALPGSKVPGKYGDVAHVVEYAILGALYFLALGGAERSDRRVKVALTAIFIASVYGVTDEFHQSFVPGRVSDVADWVRDTAGATAGVTALAAASTKAATRRPSKQ